MKVTSVYVGSAVLAIGVCAFASRSALSAGQAGALIRLQAATPGTAQVGHMNLTGAVTAGQFVGIGAIAAGILHAENTSAVAGASAVVGIASGPAQNSNGVYGRSDGPNGHGVYGFSTASSSYGGFFENTGTGLGAFAQGPSGGLMGVSTGNSGVGVYGRVDGTSNAIGVIGDATGASGDTIGVRGFSSSSSGTGVFGRANASDGNTSGGYFDSLSLTGTGVHGVVNRTTGANYGGYFKSASSAGIGAYGEATAGSGGTAGGYFKATSPAGVGVYGVATGTGTNIGVWGITNAAIGWGVFSDGRLGSSGAKLFCIDHPLDPLNKYLQHYSAEGPEPLNIYTGTITTDDKAEAWVELPSYYEAINRAPQYQLTVIDNEDFAMARIAKEIQSGRFLIKTSRPNVKVCWEIKAVRNDAWVQKYGAPVEVDKPEWQRGKYQHPELYGAPPEMAISYRPAAKAPR